MRTATVVTSAARDDATQKRREYNIIFLRRDFYPSCVRVLYHELLLPVNLNRCKQINKYLGR